jgi:hypothetical protein
MDLFYAAVLSPGPDGLLSTERLEMLREGTQECEARVFIEKALDGGKLDAGLAKRAQSLLDGRTRLSRLVHISERGAMLSYPTDWQARSDALYAMAAEVAKAVGQP